MEPKIQLASTVSPATDATVKFRIVLAELPGNSTTPFVVWYQNLENKTFFWGSYCTDLTAALNTYIEKCRKNEVTPFTYPPQWHEAKINQDGDRVWLNFENEITTEYQGFVGSTVNEARYHAARSLK